MASMKRYIIQRLLWMIVIVFGVSIIIFTVLYLTPGDPAKIMLGEGATREEIATLQAKLGIDKPYIIQLGQFLWNTFLKFNLGESWQYNVPVMQELLSRLPRTLLMGVVAMILTTIIGTPIGIFSALHQGKWQDYGIIGFCMLFISLPNFWVALMLVLIFSFKLSLLPAYGIGSVLNYILPISAMVISSVAGQARQTRSAMLEVMRADFVTTARAKGMIEKKVISKHMLPNAILPVVTMLGGRLAMVVVGSVILEKVFTIPGVGLYLVQAINYRDYPVVRGCTLFFAIFSSVIVLLTDLVYCWIDPRIKVQYMDKGTQKRGGKCKQV